jgi:hypothetical protein
MLRPQAWMVVRRGLARHETRDSTEVPPAPEGERTRVCLCERELGRQELSDQVPSALAHPRESLRFCPEIPIFFVGAFFGIIPLT